MNEQAGAGSTLKTMEIPGGLNVMEDGKPFFFEGKGRVGCLLIHGFTGTTSSMKPMGEYLAGRGLTVLGPRLPGHGTDVKDMGRHSRQEWIGAVETALREIGSMCDKVFVGGLSMGGTLTLYLGENHPDEISGLVPISAAVSRVAPGAQYYMLPLVPVLKHVMKTFPGPGNDLKDPNTTEIAYDKLSTEALHEMIKLAAGVKADLSRIKMPIRIFVSRDDHVVPPENSRYIYDNVSSADKKMIWLENSFHVATLDLDKEQIFEQTFDFIQEVAG
jgi:carboxylesterase